MIPTDVLVGRMTRGPWLNVMLVGDVLVDAGLPWCWAQLRRFVGGRHLAAHLVTHAHADHAGLTARICSTRDLPLFMGRGDADLFESGKMHREFSSRLLRVVGRAIEPVGRPVDRRLAEGDVVGPGFVVLEVPGHSTGNVALWRDTDRTLVTGDGPVNLSPDPHHPRLINLPRSLDANPAAAAAARRRLADLHPQLVLSAHGYPTADPGAWRAALQRRDSGG